MNYKKLLTALFLLPALTLASCEKQEKVMLTPAEPPTSDEVMDVMALAEQGDTEAQYRLGLMYWVELNNEEARKWFELAKKIYLR